MKRAVPIILILLSLTAIGGYYFNQYWIHRYDALIARQAGIYRLDPYLVWSVMYEETYFRPWKVGADGEIGLIPAADLNIALRVRKHLLRVAPHLALKIAHARFCGPLAPDRRRHLHQTDLAVSAHLPGAEIGLFVHDRPHQVGV